MANKPRSKPFSRSPIGRRSPRSAAEGTTTFAKKEIVMNNPLSKFIQNFFTPIIENSVREQLTVSENDNTFSRSPIGRRSPRSAAEGMTLVSMKGIQCG